MSEEFNQLAYDRTIIATLQRVLLDRFIQSDTSTKQLEQLVCEEVPRNQSIVPQVALVRIFNWLQLVENAKRQEMNAFQMVRMQAPVYLNTDGDPNAQAGKGKKARAKKPGPPPATAQ